MGGRPTLFGAAYSVYVRIARMTLIEKGVDHALVPVDVFAPEGVPGWYRDRHPFGRIPAFEHGDFTLYETAAIARYIDEGFDGPALAPAEPQARAVMAQIIGLLDAYAYRTLVWDIYVERVGKPKEGGLTDEAVVEAAIPRGRGCLAALAKLKRPGDWLLGDQLTLADLHLAPMLAYAVQAPEGRALLDAEPALSALYGRMSARRSFMDTDPDAS